MIPHPMSAQNVREMCRSELLTTVERERRADSASVTVPKSGSHLGRRVFLALIAAARALKCAGLDPVSAMPYSVLLDYPFTYDSFSATLPSSTRKISTPRTWPSPQS
jgi:hypothetical protein